MTEYTATQASRGGGKPYFYTPRHTTFVPIDVPKDQIPAGVSLDGLSPPNPAAPDDEWDDPTDADYDGDEESSDEESDTEELDEDSDMPIEAELDEHWDHDYDQECTDMTDPEYSKYCSRLEEFRLALPQLADAKFYVEMGRAGLAMTPMDVNKINIEGSKACLVRFLAAPDLWMYWDEYTPQPQQFMGISEIEDDQADQPTDKEGGEDAGDSTAPAAEAPAAATAQASQGDFASLSTASTISDVSTISARSHDPDSRIRPLTYWIGTNGAYVRPSGNEAEAAQATASGASGDAPAGGATEDGDTSMANENAQQPETGDKSNPEATGTHADASTTQEAGEDTEMGGGGEPQGEDANGATDGAGPKDTSATGDQTSKSITAEAPSDNTAAKDVQPIKNTQVSPSRNHCMYAASEADIESSHSHWPPQTPTGKRFAVELDLSEHDAAPDQQVLLKLRVLSGNKFKATVNFERKE